MLPLSKILSKKYFSPPHQNRPQFYSKNTHFPLVNNLKSQHNFSTPNPKVNPCSFPTYPQNFPHPKSQSPNHQRNPAQFSTSNSHPPNSASNIWNCLQHKKKSTQITRLNTWAKILISTLTPTSIQSKILSKAMPMSNYGAFGDKKQSPKVGTMLNGVKHCVKGCPPRDIINLYCKVPHTNVRPDMIGGTFKLPRNGAYTPKHQGPIPKIFIWGAFYCDEKKE